jgi:hypothetical protein
VCTLRICASKVASTLLSCKLLKQSLHIVKAQHCGEVAARPRKIDLCADRTCQLPFTFRKSIEHA